MGNSGQMISTAAQGGLGRNRSLGGSGAQILQELVGCVTRVHVFIDYY